MHTLQNRRRWHGLLHWSNLRWIRASSPHGVLRRRLSDGKLQSFFYNMTHYTFPSGGLVPADSMLPCWDDDCSFTIQWRKNAANTPTAETRRAAIPSHSLFPTTTIHTAFWLLMGYSASQIQGVSSVEGRIVEQQ